MPSDKAGRVVFVGNIPYGLTEEQVKDILQSAGAVSNFRLVYDKDTGRPKGFGFAEFGDADSAASAVRNLNGHEIMGRTLRVDYSNDDGGGDKAAQPAQQSQPQPQQQQQQSLFPLQNQSQPPPQPNGSADSQPSAVLPALPPGVDLPPGITCPDAISQTLAQVPPPQLLDFISQLKGLVMSDPRQVVYLLAARPQLAYAVFQALLLLGLVDTKALGQVVQADSQPQSQQPQQQQQQPPPPQPAYQQPQQPYAPQQSMPPQFQLPYQQQQMNVSTPPVQGQPYRPPTAPQKPPEFSDFQWEQIRAICSLPQPQVDAMTNITERNTVLQIRQQWGPLFASQYTGVPGY